jgi:hypothetical protein
LRILPDQVDVVENESDIEHDLSPQKGLIVSMNYVRRLASILILIIDLVKGNIDKRLNCR